ncbi:uncharacterized protein [Physcomitrium patens]|nr:uncharacterized protein LOC112295072 isoform X3 [Physcomitrium patens]XP_024401988.1 uncharacterized protein LOC112295072 isoform X3 [Physcomitrium patens]XP_024401989.1 uncharacterized protein LOC112295072 isoform X3 [Physcomitrium patens]|eukprot:XP_024401987.1 uncharacterized protein LOC112295072 isoform X3 [Physcomitrella patens]
MKEKSHTSALPVVCKRRLPHSLLVMVAVSVIFMGFWHRYAIHHASFASENLQGDKRLEEVQASVAVNSSLKLMQDELVSRVNKTQDMFKHALELVQRLEGMAQQKMGETRDTDEQILKRIDKLEQENKKLRILTLQIAKHLTDSAPWKPLKDLSKFSIRGFISEIISRDMVQGPPELFEFPSVVSNGRHLCFKGNSTRNGTENSYMFAWEESFPIDHVLLNGTTLITETEYDYGNPWHSMYNMFQFLYWKFKNNCTDADRLMLFHQSELRREMGNWITQVFSAAGLPAVPEQMSIGDRPICFKRAIVSRLGLGGVPTELFQEIYSQARCRVRVYCKLSPTRPSTDRQSTTITLMVRNGARQWKDKKAWEKVIAEQCAKVEGCRWVTMYVSNMTFCEQVKLMMETDILVSVHGAQLTNMIFMSPGGRLMEMFPKGWLEFAGHGQFIYRQLARWNGLIHEGYWRDIHQPDCPNTADIGQCFTFYKDQDVGIDVEHISRWLRKVLKDFREVNTHFVEEPSFALDARGDYKACACASNYTHNP